jgi:general secretion pathway protein G
MINRLMEKKRNGEAGFTLIEMLIVVIILGILAAVVVFGVSTFRDDSVKEACRTDKKQAETAIAAVIAKTGLRPGDAAPGTAPAGVSPDYLKTWPSNTSYRVDYDPSGAGNGFVINAETPASTDTTPVAFTNC